MASSAPNAQLENNPMTAIHTVWCCEERPQGRRLSAGLFICLRVAMLSSLHDTFRNATTFARFFGLTVRQI